MSDADFLTQHANENEHAISLTNTFRPSPQQPEGLAGGEGGSGAPRPPLAIPENVLRAAKNLGITLPDPSRGQPLNPNIPLQLLNVPFKVYQQAIEESLKKGNTPDEIAKWFSELETFAASLAMNPIPGVNSKIAQVAAPDLIKGVESAAAEGGVIHDFVTSAMEALGPKMMGKTEEKALGNRALIDPSRFSKEMLDTHIASGGATFNPRLGNMAGQDAASVSVFPELGRVLDHQPSQAELEQFVQKNAKLLEEHPHLSVGSWFDEASKKHHLDIVATLPEKQAVKLGRKYNQKAVFHLGRFEEIPTGGTGKALDTMPPIADRLRTLEQLAFRAERRSIEPENVKRASEILKEGPDLATTAPQPGIERELLAMAEEDDPALQPVKDLVKSHLRQGSLGVKLPSNLDETGKINTGTAIFLGRVLAGAGIGAAMPAHTRRERIRNTLIGLGLGAIASPALIKKVAGVGVRAAEKGALTDVTATPAEAEAFARVNPDMIKLGDKALHIDWEQLRDPEKLDQTYKKLVHMLGEEGFETARGGVISDEKMRGMARALGMTEDEFRTTPLSKLGDAAHAQAAIDLLGHSMSRLNRMGDLMAQVNPASPQYAAAREAYMQQLGVTKSVLQKFIGVRADAGRTLRLFGGAAQQLPNTDQLGSLLDAVEKGLVPPERLADLMKALPGEDQKWSFFTMAMKTGSYSLKYMNNIFINSLLAGFKSNAAKLMSEGLAAGNSVFERSLATGIGTVRQGAVSAVGGTPAERIYLREAEYKAYGMLHAWHDAGSAFKETLLTGKYAKLGEDVEEATQVKQHVQDLPPDVLRQYGLWARAVDHMAKTINAENGLGKVIAIPGRFMSADTSLWQAFNYRGELWALAAREADDQLAKGLITKGDVGRKIADLLDDETWVKAASDMAAKEAIENTFVGEFGTHPLLKALGAKQGTLDHIGDALTNNPFLRFFVPFYRVPTNLVRYSFDRFPGLGLLSKRNLEALSAGGREADLALARQAEGAMAAGSLGYLIYSGAIEVDGGGPRDPELRKMWQQAGHLPDSIKIGNHRVGFGRMEPYGSYLGVVADAAEIYGELSPDQRGELAAALALAFGKNFTDKTYAKGFHDFLDALMANDEKTLTEKLTRLAEQPAVDMASPTFLNQLRPHSDREVKEIKSMLDMWKSRIPGYSKDVYPRQYLNGDPVLLPHFLGPEALSIVPYEKIKSDPVAKVLTDFGMKKLMHVSPVPWTVEGHTANLFGDPDPKAGVTLTSKQHYRLAAAAGNYLKIPASRLDPNGELGLKSGSYGMWDTLGAIIQSPKYKALPTDQARADLMTKVIHKYRKLAIDAMTVKGFPGGEQWYDPDLAQKVLNRKLEKIGQKFGKDAQEKVQSSQRMQDALKQIGVSQ